VGILDPRETDCDRLRDRDREARDSPERDALITELRAHNATLREQLESERQAHSEARRLLAAALERIPPQLEPPPEAREAPDTPTEEAERPEGKLPTASDGGLIMEKAWLGVDAGKEFHWAHMLDASGQQLLSRKVENDEADISALIDEALSFAEEVDWAVDQPGGGAVLLLALLWERDQRVLYVPGLSVDRARDTYRGESKSDARDARVIADQARMRGDLGKLKAGEQELAELQLLLARRRDLVTDQSRTITRLR
jgi:Transposase